MLLQNNCTRINTNFNNDCAMTINTAIQIMLILLNNTSISDNTKSTQQHYLYYY